MSWSFNITGGDLILGGPGGFSTLSGTDKLLQDLRCRLLEPLGTDPMHPDFGSSLDGGIDTSGAQIVSHIGSTLTPEVALEVEAEVIRCLQSHQQTQIARLREEQQTYGGKTYLTNEELLYQIISVDSVQIQDTLVVRVVLQTGSGQTINITQPVGTL